VNCEDYSVSERPSMNASCSCEPQCDGKQCGPDGCGGNCPPGCGPNATCQGGTCVCTGRACGSACCAAGEVCYGGACCKPSCSGKECGTDGCGGSCGSCPGTLACGADGKCGCVGGLTRCDTECVDTLSDAHHCGDCTTVCETPLVCANGTCSETCPEGYTNCDGSCADLQSNHDHCGSCERACGPEAVCVQGECACENGLTDCPGQGCVDLATDPANCGACGRVCEGCSEGRCPGDGQDAGSGLTNELRGWCGCRLGGRPNEGLGGAITVGLCLIAGCGVWRRRRQVEQHAEPLVPWGRRPDR